MHENKDPRRLLLLCVRAACLSAHTCQELRQNGPGHVRSHQVSFGQPDWSIQYLEATFKQNVRVILRSDMNRLNTV